MQNLAELYRIFYVLQILKDYLDMLFPIKGVSFKPQFQKCLGKGKVLNVIQCIVNNLNNIKNTKGLLEFELENPKSLEILFSEGFSIEIASALYKSSVLEIWKLLDRAQLGKKENLSLEHIIDRCDLSENEKKILYKVLEWLRSSKLKLIKEIRNKIIAHLDKSYVATSDMFHLLFPLPNYPSQQSIEGKLKETFKDLWEAFYIMAWITVSCYSREIKPILDWHTIGFHLMNAIEGYERKLNKYEFYNCLSSCIENRENSKEAP
jgi:hypothetical protein